FFQKTNLLFQFARQNFIICIQPLYIVSRRLPETKIPGIIAPFCFVLEALYQMRVLTAIVLNNSLSSIVGKIIYENDLPDKLFLCQTRFYASAQPHLSLITGYNNGNQVHNRRTF